MSADNWNDCPKCGAENELKENYNTTQTDGTVYFIYSCICYECKFRKKIEYEKDLLED